MFARIKRGGNKAHPHDYLCLVEAYRDAGKPKHRVLANLGRLDGLLETGQLDSLIQSLARFSQHVRVLSSARLPQVSRCQARLWGPPLVFARLWERQGIGQILHRLAARRHFKFDVERVVFAMALQRLCRPGSDLQGCLWAQGVEAPGFEDLELQHFYRTAAFLCEVRQDLEHQLFLRDRDLFSQELDLLLIDTTSLYVYRDEETAWRRRGYSRDRRPDLPQWVLAVAVDRHGWPVAWELFPGNTVDRNALVGMIGLLRERFQIRRVIVVADRAMISRGLIALLTESEEAPLEYILGCKLRAAGEVPREVLRRAGRYHPVAENLDVKEVGVEGRRYIVCRNPEDAMKDAATRAAILDQLKEQIRRAPREMVGNQGFKRFVRVDPGGVQINPAAVKTDARLDGKFVLRTNTDLSPEEVAQTYKSLWRVERTFREEKSTLAIRPIFHRLDETSIGHIVAAFLALRLEVHLQRALDEKGVEVSWPELMQDMGHVQAVYLTFDGQPWRIRTDLAGSAHAAFEAAGVRPPERVTPLPAEGHA